MLLDPQGFVCQGSGENVFIVRDGALHTPDLVRRRARRHHARDDHRVRRASSASRCIERRITRDEIYIADEAFFTGTAAEVTPIREYDHRVDRHRGARPDHGEAAAALLRHGERPQRRRSSTGSRKSDDDARRREPPVYVVKAAGPAGVLPEPGDAAVGVASARVSRHRRERRGALPVLQHALPARRRRRPACAALTSLKRAATAARSYVTERILVVAPSLGRRRDPVRAADRADPRAVRGTRRRRAGAALVRAGLRAHARHPPRSSRARSRTATLDLRARKRARRATARRRATRARSCCRTRGSPRSCRGSRAFRARTGYGGELRYGLLNDARRLDRKAFPRLVDRFAALAAPPGALVPMPPAPVLVPDLAESQRGRARVAPARRTVRRSMLCPGAEYGPAKRWPPTHFAELAARFLREGHAGVDRRLAERQAGRRSSVLQAARRERAR